VPLAAAATRAWPGSRESGVGRNVERVLLDDLLRRLLAAAAEEATVVVHLALFLNSPRTASTARLGRHCSSLLRQGPVGPRRLLRRERRAGGSRRDVERAQQLLDAPVSPDAVGGGREPLHVSCAPSNVTET